MPWRLFTFIVLLVLIMVFVGYNLENRADISVIVHTFEDVPIFFSMFGSFLAGILIMLPFTLGFSFKKGKKKSSGGKKGAEKNQQAGTGQEKAPDTQASQNNRQS